MRRIIGSTAATLLLALVGAGAAGAAQSDTITTNWSIPSFPSSTPAVGNYSGSYTDTFGRSGTVTVQALLTAIASPSVGDLQTLRTYSDGSGDTLVLRCHQIAKDFSNPNDVPNSGSCAVLSGSGAYAGLAGSGPISGDAAFTATGADLADVVALG